MAVAPQICRGGDADDAGADDRDFFIC